MEENTGMSLSLWNCLGKVEPSLTDQGQMGRHGVSEHAS